MEKKARAKKITKITDAEEIHLVHRISKDKTHRIEYHDSKLKPELGEWAAYTAVASLRHWRATMFGPFPSVFKVIEVSARLLDEHDSGGVMGQTRPECVSDPKTRPM